MIKSFQAFALQSIGIINWGDDVFSSFEDSLVHNQFILQENDVVVITSKVITMQQKAAILLSEIIPSEKAIKLGEEAKLDPRVAELVLQESNNQVYGCVFH
ncbi:MAG: coenzyme F420-0:L-glutamate ligase, partial [Candidatus Heimdallarchaeota archaeon]|nr:coenzyme F420-0:L-glutamate ligase [Candidatus Heimdallarchaeota archaeon]